MLHKRYENPNEDKNRNQGHHQWVFLAIFSDDRTHQGLADRGLEDDSDEGLVARKKHN